MTGPTPDDRDTETSDAAPAEVPIEAPEADVAEQHEPVTPDPVDRPRGDVPLDADPADVAEQQREVGLDEDDYR